MRILIIEDEYPLADAISETLKKENFNVNIVTDGIDGENEALTGIYDLILLDIMLLGKDGFEILQSIKQEKIKTPIIMLTAKSQMNDKLQGLENGADDYITKPFHTRELLARIKNILKRTNDVDSINKLEFGDLTLNLDTCQISCNENSIVINGKELELLQLLMVNKGQVVDREVLANKIWGYDSEAEYNNVVDSIGNKNEDIEQYVYKAYKQNKEKGIVGNYVYKVRTSKMKDERATSILMEDESVVTRIKFIYIYAISGSIISIIIAYAISKKISNMIVKPVKETMESQKRFISDASHELKTPLAVIEANAVFSTGENAKVYVYDTTIKTTGESSSRGLDSTYRGYIEADNVTISTEGGSCATLATDRGEGTVIAKNSVLSTKGAGSPVIYSTGDISIENTKGTATGAQMAVIEGKNTATVTNSTLSCSGKGNRNDADNCGIMIYQSMSGDAGEGTGTFTSKNSTLEITSDSSYYTSAPFFFVTNTKAVINLEQNTLKYGSGVLLKVAATSEWGQTGSNGGEVTFNMTNQEAKGSIEVDNISTLEINLKQGSKLETTINSANTAKSIALNIDSTSTLTLTGDCYVTSLTDEDTSYSNINFNGYKLYVNGTAIN